MADDAGGATAPISNGAETAAAGRAADGRFVAGGPGGPGRPRGSRHRAQVALDAIGEAGAVEVLRAVLQAAVGGDVQAAKIVLDRIWPTRKDRTVELELPPVATAAGLAPALAAVAAAMGRAELAPAEALAIAQVLAAQARAIEVAEMDQRMATLEECAAALPGAGRCR